MAPYPMKEYFCSYRYILAMLTTKIFENDKKKEKTPNRSRLIILEINKPTKPGGLPVSLSLFFKANN
jgi:hypothetical protein